jgi:hypothetical protein
VGHGRRYRLVCRMTGNDVDAATCEPDQTWAIGDTVILAPKRRYRIVDVLPGDPPFDAVWIVESLWQP